MPRPPDRATLHRLEQIVGAGGWTDNPDEIAPHLVEWRNRYQGATPLLLRPASTAEVAGVVRACAQAEVAIVPQGGNTGLVGGQIPHPDGSEVLVSLGRMRRVRSVDPLDNTLTVEAGCTLVEVQQGAGAADRSVPLRPGAGGKRQSGRR